MVFPFEFTVKLFIFRRCRNTISFRFHSLQTHFVVHTSTFILIFSLSHPKWVYTQIIWFDGEKKIINLLLSVFVKNGDTFQFFFHLSSIDHNWDCLQCSVSLHHQFSVSIYFSEIILILHKMFGFFFILLGYFHEWIEIDSSFYDFMWIRL